MLSVEASSGRGSLIIWASYPHEELNVEYYYSYKQFVVYCVEISYNSLIQCYKLQCYAKGKQRKAPTGGFRHSVNCKLQTNTVKHKSQKALETSDHL